MSEVRTGGGKTTEPHEAGSDDAPQSGRAAKPAQIVAAARELFLAQGYGATSMDAVARAAPVSKRTLYNHFESKEALFGAVLKNAWSSLGDPKLESGHDVRETLRRFVKRLEIHWGHPDVIPLLRLLIAEGGRFPEMTDVYYKAGKAPAVAELASYLGRVDDRLKQDAEARAVQFLGMIKEAIFWPQVLGFPAARDPDAVIEAAIGRILD